MTIVLQWLPLTVLLIDVVIKIVALGTIPRNRRPSSSLAWLLLITVTPVFGLILFLLIGSPFVRGRRERVQIQANQVILSTQPICRRPTPNCRSGSGVWSG